MRVGIDATPLLGARTGVGQYVAGLLEGLAVQPEPPEVQLAAFTWRGTAALPVGPPVAGVGRRAPARALQAMWRRLPLPPVEWLTGSVDVFHATNYVLPPLRSAAGVLSLHDLSYLHHADTVTAATLRYRALVPRGLRRAGAVCVLSATLAGEVAAEYGVPREQIVVAPPGVAAVWHAATPPTAAWLAERGLPARYLLFVGSREPRKNLPVLLDAVAALHDEDPAAPPLVLVGPPGWGPALDASRLPAHAVVTPGYLDTADLVRVVAGAACLAFPSRYEGFGMPPLEALATGTPVVASDLPVLREVLGDAASFVPVGDADALAAALAAALGGDGGDIAREQRRAQAASYTWAATAAAVMSAYQLALA